jgi:lipoprotein-anchoring transpeptidase ErfK/SrfK
MRAVSFPRIVAVLMVAALAAAVNANDADAKSAKKSAKPKAIVALTEPVTVRAPGDLPLYANPGDATAASALPAKTEFGSQTVLLATERQGKKWYRVLLPTRPNGSSAWVRKADVELRVVRDELRVDLAAHTLTWLRDGEVVLITDIAIGSPDTPTPTGFFYVTDLLDNADDSGPYGPFALGISAHSDTLSEFAGGDGQIGVHGTNAPWSIGKSVSHGCVRVPNDIVAQLATNLSLGTPVTIA